MGPISSAVVWMKKRKIDVDPADLLEEAEYNKKITNANDRII